MTTQTKFFQVAFTCVSSKAATTEGEGCPGVSKTHDGAELWPFPGFSAFTGLTRSRSSVHRLPAFKAIRPAAGPHLPLESSYSHIDKVLLCYGRISPCRFFFFLSFFSHHFLDLSGHGPPTESHCLRERWGTSGGGGLCNGGHARNGFSALSSFPPPTQGQDYTSSPSREGFPISRAGFLGFYMCLLI